MGTADLDIKEDSITFRDPTRKYHVTYTQPLLRIALSPHTSYAPIKWDPETKSIIVTLPNALEAPVLLAFGLYPQPPTTGTPSAFPSVFTRIIRPIKELIDNIGSSKPKKLQVCAPASTDSP